MCIVTNGASNTTSSNPKQETFSVGSSVAIKEKTIAQRGATNHHEDNGTTFDYRLWGNIFHCISMINVMVYAMLVIMYGNTKHPKSGQVFDDKWLQEGFCISNENIPYWSSHDLCLYADTVLGLIVGLLYLSLGGRRSGRTTSNNNSNYKQMEQANDLMKWQAFSVIGHGLAHGSMASKLRNMSPEDVVSMQDSSQYEILQHSLAQATDYEETIKVIGKLMFITLCFWFPLIRSAIPRHVHHIKVLFLSLVVVLGGLHVQRQHGFTYVQTIITLIFTYSELIGKTFVEKNMFSYMIFAFVGIPIGIVPWFEAMSCQTSGYMKYGGHVLYDISIPIWLIIAYISCYMKYRKEQQQQQSSSTVVPVAKEKTTKIM